MVQVSELLTISQNVYTKPLPIIEIPDISSGS